MSTRRIKLFLWAFPLTWLSVHVIIVTIFFASLFTDPADFPPRILMIGGLVWVLLILGFCLFRYSAGKIIIGTLASISFSIFAIDSFISLNSLHHDGCALYRIGKAKALGADYDARTVLEATLDRRNSDPNVVPYIAPLNTVRLSDFSGKKAELRLNGKTVAPLSGIPSAHTIYGNELGFFVEWKSDKWGFNNSDSTYSLPIDIALLGDSFTNGCCVDRENTIHGVLKKNWPATISLGSGGTGSLSQLGILREFGTKLKPRHVVWIYVDNDWPDLNRELADPILSKYLDPEFSQNLADNSEHLRSQQLAFFDSFLEQFPSSKIVRIATGFHLQSWLKRRFVRSSENIESSKEQSLENLRAIFSMGHELVKSWDGRLHLLFLNEFAMRDEIIRTAGNVGLNILDAHPDLRELSYLRPISPFGTCGHLNEAGYENVAKTISKEISRGGL